MTILCGKKRVDVEPWGGEESGKVLLMTRDEGVKAQITAALSDAPDLFEMLTEPDVVACDEDTEGLMMVIVSRKDVAVFFDLEKLTLGICMYQEEV